MSDHAKTDKKSDAAKKGGGTVDQKFKERVRRFMDKHRELMEKLA